MKTSVSSSAQSLSTQPGMLSGPAALLALLLLKDLLMLSEDSAHTWSPGRGEVFCTGGAVVCLEPGKKVIQLIQQRGGAVTGLWCGLGVHHGPYHPPLTLCISAVTEAKCYPPGVLPPWPL